LSKIYTSDPGEVDWANEIHVESDHAGLWFFCPDSVQGQAGIDDVPSLADSGGRDGMIDTSTSLVGDVEEVEVGSIVGHIGPYELDLRAARRRGELFLKCFPFVRHHVPEEDVCTV